MNRSFRAALLAAALCLVATPALPLFDTVAPGIVQSFPATLTASTTATTGAMTATLTGSSNKVVSICGFVITSAGTTTPIVVNATIGPVQGQAGTLNFAYAFVSVGQGVLGVAMPQCIASTGQNTPIVVTVPGGGTGTIAALTAWGNQQ